MSSYFEEKYIEDLIRKELKKILLNKEKRIKEKINFLGEDLTLRKDLEKNFEISKNSEILIVSSLNIKNLYNISVGIYTDEYEKEIIEYILSSKKVIILDEGVEYKKYETINLNLLKNYKKYLKNIESFGVNFLTRDDILKNIGNIDKARSFKLLDLKRIRDYNLANQKEIVVLKSTIVTSSAIDYAKENGIRITKKNK